MSWTRSASLFAVLCGCSGSTAAPTPLPPATPDASDGIGDAAAPDSEVANVDGTPTRVACTSSFGKALSTAHGRLDGYLVSVVPASTRACNGDDTHIHLQVKMGTSVYDVAVNVDGLEAEVDASLPGTPWSEGWHAGEDLDYVKDFGLHSTSFSLTGLSAVRERVESGIASANHVSVYATGYGHDGVHLVHHQGSGQDGALIIDPLGPKAHVFAFRFDTQNF